MTFDRTLTACALIVIIVTSVLLTGCWTSAERSVPLSGSTPAKNIVVRMANNGEFPEPPPPTSGDGDLTFTPFRMGCDTSGPLVKAYYKPVAAFARERLLEADHGEVHESLVESVTHKPRLGDGVNIVVAPMGVGGELRVVQAGPPFYAPGTAWAEKGYCVHVIHQAGTDPAIRPLNLTIEEKRDLVAFLNALTDESLATNPRFLP